MIISPRDRYEERCEVTLVWMVDGKLSDIERGGHNVVSDYENKVYRVGSVRVNKVTIDSTLLLASLRINR